jgi:hypothetical protein
LGGLVPLLKVVEQSVDVHTLKHRPVARIPAQRSGSAPGQGVHV